MRQHVKLLKPSDATNLADDARLDHNYTVFANVVSGMDVVDGILEGDQIDQVRIVEGRKGSQSGTEVRKEIFRGSAEILCGRQHRAADRRGRQSAARPAVSRRQEKPLPVETHRSLSGREHAKSAPRIP